MADVPRQSRAVVAAFDVDGTLTRRDCVVPFLRELVGHPPSSSPRSPSSRHGDPRRSPAATATRSRRSPSPRAAVDDTEAVAAVGREVRRTGPGGGCGPTPSPGSAGTSGQGHRVVLVSASLRPYLEPLAAHLGAHDVLCTDVRGRRRRPAHRPAARRQLPRPGESRASLAWMVASARDEPVELWAYGDSAGDRELLALRRPAAPREGCRRDRGARVIRALVTRSPPQAVDEERARLRGPRARPGCSTTAKQFGYALLAFVAFCAGVERHVLLERPPRRRRRSSAPDEAPPTRSPPG